MYSQDSIINYNDNISHDAIARLAITEIKSREFFGGK